jgi:hypothetical protein
MQIKQAANKSRRSSRDSRQSSRPDKSVSAESSPPKELLRKNQPMVNSTGITGSDEKPAGGANRGQMFTFTETHTSTRSSATAATNSADKHSNAHANSDQQPEYGGNIDIESGNNPPLVCSRSKSTSPLLTDGLSQPQGRISTNSSRRNVRAPVTNSNESPRVGRPSMDNDEIDYDIESGLLLSPTK